MKKILVITAALMLAACAEPGSERWCAKMSEKPKGDWSANEAGTYAKHCLVDGTATDAEE